MERFKLFTVSAVGVLVLASLTLWGVRAYNHSKINDQLSYYDALQTGIRQQCIVGTPESTRLWEEVVLNYNETILTRRDRNNSGFIGDFITSDHWEFVDLIAIPSEQECAKLVRESKIRQCELFMKGDWQRQFDALSCGELLGSAYAYH